MHNPPNNVRVFENCVSKRQGKTYLLSLDNHGKAPRYQLFTDYYGYTTGPFRKNLQGPKLGGQNQRKFWNIFKNRSIFEDVHPRNFFKISLNVYSRFFESSRLSCVFAADCENLILNTPVTLDKRVSKYRIWSFWYYSSWSLWHKTLA